MAGSSFAGIACPECGSIDLKVLETRRLPQAIERTRSCDRRHKFSTIETVVGVTPPATIGTPEDAAKIRRAQMKVLPALTEKPDDIQQ